MLAPCRELTARTSSSILSRSFTASISDTTSAPLLAAGGLAEEEVSEAVKLLRQRVVKAAAIQGEDAPSGVAKVEADPGSLLVTSSAC